MVEISISRIIADFFIMLCCAIPLLIFHEFVTPYKRGFYCDDESIRYPFRPSTVSRQMLIIVGLIVPTIIIFSTEVFRALAWERKCVEQFNSYRCRQFTIHRLIVRLYVFLGYFMLGVVFNQLMVDIAKYTIGRHRPHFIDVCKPKGFETCPINSHQYITDFECTGTDKYLVHESMLSFYSGHSAFSFYAAWFTSLYLQARLYRPLFSRLLLPVIQFTLFGLAAFVAYTRVSNYKHHWSDVLIGAIMGSIIGIFVAVFVAEVFSRREIPECDQMRLHEFGVARRFEKAPIADVESGLHSATDGMPQKQCCDSVVRDEHRLHTTNFQPQATNSVTQQQTFTLTREPGNLADNTATARYPTQQQPYIMMMSSSSTTSGAPQHQQQPYESSQRLHTDVGRPSSSGRTSYSEAQRRAPTMY